MKVICLKNHLHKASVLSEKIIGNNPTLPILSAVLISTEGNKIKLSSTNLEIGLEIIIPAQIKKEGRITLPAKLFSNLISSLSEEKNIKLDSLNNNLIITTSNTSTTIKGYNTEDFPILPKIKEKKIFIVSSNDIINGLKSVYYSTSLSEMKPELNSVYLFSSKNNPLTFVATDSFRLSEKTIQYNFSDFPSILIPYRSAVEILRIFEDINEDVKLILDDNNFIIKTDNIKFTSRLIEGNFPEYKQIIPSKFTNKVIVNKKDLVGALKTTSMFCGKLNEVRLKIYKGDNFLEFQTTNPEIGEHIIKIPGKIEGDNLTIVFNHRYLTDCLSSLNNDDILFKFAGDGKSLLITSLNNNSFSYLVMPMKNI